MDKAVFVIDNCCKCPYSYQERVYTPDPLEFETGVYCSKVEDKYSYNKKHKLVVADEDVEYYAQIPDWCPLLINTNWIAILKGEYINCVILGKETYATKLDRYKLREQ